MRGNILKRIELLEKETGTNVIPEKDRIIVVTFLDGDKAEFDRKVQERMVELREKYGPNIKKDDFTVVGIRKFYSKKKGSEATQ
jgi:hypothetical protein